MSKNTEATVLEPTLEDLSKTYEGAKKEVNREIQSKTDDIADLKLDLSEMSQKLYGHRNFSEKTNWGKMTIWLIILLAVGAVEIPVNMMALEIFLRTETVTTWMAIGFGTGIAFLAHITGFGFKRLKVGDNLYGVLGYVGLIVAVILFYMSSRFRMDYAAMMHKDTYYSIWSQFWFSIGIFLIGVIFSYFFSTDAKSYHLERIFKGDVSRLRKLKSQLQDLISKRTRLFKQYQLDHNRIQKSNREEEQRQREVIISESSPVKENKESIKSKSSDFDDLERDFNKEFKTAKRLFESYGENKEGLRDDVAFMTSKSSLAGLLRRLDQLANAVPNGVERVETMENEFKTLSN